MKGSIKMADIFELFKKISTESHTKKAPITHIIVGLGNPGDKYYLTRHNAGFLSMDYLSQKYGAKIDRLKFKALCGECEIGGVGVLLMKPQTFMNSSGEAVAEAAKFYKVSPENIIVIYDDINLDVARLRVRGRGSDGGHNGIKSIVSCIGCSDFPRIRIGVGQKPHPDYDLVDWVLGSFSEEDRKKLFDAFPRVCEGAEKLLHGELEGAMQICNSKS
jgi:PTH1 family peptidyl-tRNA hydrolase